MRYSNEDFEASKFLGHAVGKKNKFMRDIACMGTEERELAGYIEATRILIKNAPKEEQPSKEETKVLDVMFTVVQAIGQGKFNQDIVTHLSMKTEAEEATHSAH